MNRSIDAAMLDVTTGFGLKVRRQALGVQARTIAQYMGVTRSRVGAIEASRLPTRTAQERYLEALEKAAGER